MINAGFETTCQEGPGPDPQFTVNYANRDPRTVNND
jgi:hypothetical protein